MASTLRISLYENSYSVENNTSNVTAVVYIDTTYSWNLYSPSGHIDFSGNYSAGYNFSHGFDKYTTTELARWTFNVTHNADGTGSISASAYFDTDIAEGRIWASASLNLTTIPRASKPSVPKTSYELGEQIPISTNRKSSAFTHTVRWNWAEHQAIIAQNVGASVNWTPPLSMAAYLTNEVSRPCTIIVNTYNGNTLVGTETTEFTLKIPESVKPSIPSVIFDDDAGADAVFGHLLSVVSDIRVKPQYEEAYGADVYKIAVKLDSEYGEATGLAVDDGVLIGKIDKSGELQVTATATDTRGRQGTYTGTVGVYDYEPTDVSSSRAYRYNSTTGSEDDESDKIRVAVVCSVHNPKLGSSTLTNQATVKVMWMQRGGASWTTAQTDTVTGDASYTVDIAGTFSTLQSFVIRVEATDKTGTTVYTDIIVSTAKPVLDFKATGDGVGILGISNKAGLRVNDVIHITQDGGIDIEDETGASQAFVRPQANGRPLLQNHAALANGKYLQGQLSGGTFANLLAVNADNQVEMGWTSGGLRGRVRKELWEGTLDAGGFITLSEHAYYNELLVWVSGDDYPITLHRAVTGDPSAWFNGGGIRCNVNNANQINVIAVWLTPLVNNTARLRLERCQVIALGSGSVGSLSDNKIVKIEGVL